jgi:DNA-binding transcriptional MerR regulator
MLVKHYSTAEAASLSGFTVRQLDYWYKQKVLIPSVQQSKGSGTRRKYGFDDLVNLRFIRRLKDHGWSTQKIRIAITKLEHFKKDPNFEKPILIYEKQMLLAICQTEANERIFIDALNPSGQQIMWIALDALVEETRDLVTHNQRSHFTFAKSKKQVSTTSAEQNTENLTEAAS